MYKLRTPLLIAFIFTAFLLIVSFTYNTSPQRKLRYKEGEILVKFKKGIGVSKAASIHNVVGAKLKKHLHNFGIEHLELPRGMTVEEAIAHYKKNPDVLYAEPNYRVRKATVPNDPLYNNQWHHKKIASESAWDTATGDNNVIIAVLDTGVDYNHPDLKNNMWKDVNGFYGHDFANDDDDPMDDDIDGSGSHGTHVAGIIGAVGNNSLGVTGINWTVKIMAIKVLDKNGSGYISDIIEGINYAKNNNAKIINLSLEAPENVTGINSLKDAIISAKDSNILVVCAAGNSGYDLKNINIYPASYRLENLISVASTDNSDILGNYSNRGTNVVHLAAPGSNIFSTQSKNAPGFKNYSTAYFTETGTSMAAPMVAGVAGLLLSKNSNYGYKELKELILASVDKLNLPVITGGRLNAQKAMTLDLNNMSPLKPENFSLANPLSAGQPIELKWFDLSSVETGYKIERDLKNTGFSFLADLPANTANYTDNTALLNEGDRVSYRLYAQNSNGYSDPAQIDLQIPLNMPTQLTVSKVSEGVRLNWKDNTSNEDGYEIWRQSGTNSYEKIGIVSKDVTTYLDTNLANAIFYYYKIRAYNAQGVYSDFSNEAFLESQVSNKSSSGGKCFIATAAYGTPFHPHIDVLRDFRDKVLIKYSVGRMFISAYYKYSPPVAEIVKEHLILRILCLTFILPVVYVIKFPIISVIFLCISFTGIIYRKFTTYNP